MLTKSRREFASPSECELPDNVGVGVEVDGVEACIKEHIGRENIRGVEDVCCVPDAGHLQGVRWGRAGLTESSCVILEEGGRRELERCVAGIIS